jgi:hypothetical protein
MDITIPHIKHCTRAGSNKHFGFIEVDGNSIHEIENLDEFYKAFGYSTDIAKAGILPDEFMWDEYIRDTAVNFNSCFQIHLIEYLFKHSDPFREKYGKQFESWIEAYAETLITDECMLCATCRMNLFCSRRNRIRNAMLNAGNKSIESDDWIDSHYEEISASGNVSTSARHTQVGD